MPPCSAYITSVGTWSLEHGLFIKASKQEDVEATKKTSRKAAIPNQTTTIKVNDYDLLFMNIQELKEISKVKKNRLSQAGLFIIQAADQFYDQSSCASFKTSIRF